MSKAKDEGKNILIVGVGGQGVILASEILSEVALMSGYDVKKSEVHGMAQRGGIVSSHVRYGPKVFSPIIPKGEVDVLLAFEIAEALRWVSYLRPNGRVIASRQKMVPPMVSLGLASYPEQAEEALKAAVDEPILVDALDLAEGLGNPRLVNTILLGITSRLLGLPERKWRTVISERVPQAYKDLNLRAFDAGRALV